MAETEPQAVLFADEIGANLISTAELVEDALHELGHDPEACRADAPGARRGWTCSHGSAHVTIALVDREDYLHLRVSASIMRPDDKVDTHRLYRRLLTLNAVSVHGAAFAAHLDEIKLITERSTIDLDKSEVKDLISRVCRYADRYDDQLVEEFGGTRG
jgi:hypothetical protein